MRCFSLPRAVRVVSAPAGIRALVFQWHVYTDLDHPVRTPHVIGSALPAFTDGGHAPT